MNSETQESPNTTPPSTNTPLVDSELLSAEAPTLTENPTQKPLTEMTEQELQDWHARLTAHLHNPQTLAAHVRAGGTTAKEEKRREPRVDPNKYA